MLTHRTPHHFRTSFRGVRSTNPDSIRLNNGFSGAQLRIIARDFVAPRNDSASHPSGSTLRRRLHQNGRKPSRFAPQLRRLKAVHADLPLQADDGALGRLQQRE